MSLQLTRFDSYKSTQLTNREIEVLFLMAKEKCAFEIAQELKIKESTVNTHRKNMYSKLDVTKSAGAIRKGFEYGYLRFEK